MWIDPGCDDVSTGKPLSRKTSIIRWLSGITSAVNTEIPLSCATSARWASSRVPSPSPCRSRAIVNAISASDGAAGEVVPLSDHFLVRATDRDQAVHPRVVDIRHQVGGCLQVGAGGEEPEHARTLVEPLEKRQHRVFVLGTDGADANSRAVAERHVRLPVGRITVLARLLGCLVGQPGKAKSSSSAYGRASHGLLLTQEHGSRHRLFAASLRRNLISTNQFKNGTHIDVDGTVFRIVEFQHVKPGKGGAFVRSKLKRVDDGAVIDKTFKAGEKFRPVRTETRKMQFLYDSGEAAVFMDNQSYDQVEIPKSVVGDALKWVPPNSDVDLLFVDERPAGAQPASAVDLAITQTDPGLKGDTASGGGTKPATLETGVVVQVPLFIEEGERVRVDTRSGEYVSRA